MNGQNWLIFLGYRGGWSGLWVINSGVTTAGLEFCGFMNHWCFSLAYLKEQPFLRHIVKSNLTCTNCMLLVTISNFGFLKSSSKMGRWSRCESWFTFAIRIFTSASSAFCHLPVCHVNLFFLPFTIELKFPNSSLPNPTFKFFIW